MEERAADWHEHETSALVTDIHGARIRGAMMRREIDGRVEYRRMTDKEFQDYLSRTAW